MGGGKYIKTKLTVLPEELSGLIEPAMNETVNFTRYQKGQKKGHYESFFQRANHPSEPKAFWIRYTIFSPDNHPEKAIGELWAIYFDGITHQHISVKKEVLFEKCIFENNRFFIEIGTSFLENGKLSGNIFTENNSIEWNLNYTGNSETLFPLPENLYEGNFPKAKILVGLPLASYSGNLLMNGNNITIANWIGSQNHNWGIRHTDHYAWGQVAGFDNAPESFFEVTTARLKFGPVWTPFMTLMTLRHKGHEYRLNTIFQSLKAKGKFDHFNWRFYSKNSNAEIEGTIFADKNDFVHLKYYNPPGRIKNCLNTKIASAKIKIRYKDSSGKFIEDILEAKNRAAFEILED